MIPHKKREQEEERKMKQSYLLRMETGTSGFITMDGQTDGRAHFFTPISHTKKYTVEQTDSSCNVTVMVGDLEKIDGCAMLAIMIIICLSSMFMYYHYGKDTGNQKSLQSNMKPRAREDKYIYFSFGRTSCIFSQYQF